MTGKDLILYILQNNLENEVVIKDGVFVWFMHQIQLCVYHPCFFSPLGSVTFLKKYK